MVSDLPSERSDTGHTACRIWFPEPAAQDDTYINRGEHKWDWLARSTVPKAGDYRRFLNEHLAYLSAHDQQKLVHDLHERWDSAFFELVLARILQELGAAIEIEPITSDGKHPDLLARFPDATVVVEATTPVINRVVGEETIRRAPLLDFIESKVPEGWVVYVCELPNIGPMDSQKEFRRVVTRLLDIRPPDRDDTDQELIAKLSTGTIYLNLIPCRWEHGRLGWEPPVMYWDNTSQRIRHAIQKKRRQVRNTKVPVLLAIDTSNNGDLGDFDRALFGYTYDLHDHGKTVEICFNPDGEFNKGYGEPTYAGVLACPRVSSVMCSMPVLYRHPRFSGDLPAAILQLEQRIYSSETREIQGEPCRVPDLIQRLNLVNA